MIESSDDVNTVAVTGGEITTCVTGGLVEPSAIAFAW